MIELLLLVEIVIQVRHFFMECWKINDDVRRFINFELSNQYMLFLQNCDGPNISDNPNTSALTESLIFS